ncbi:MAG: hypothetical protein ABEH64_08380 [Salinirussus sp.]
MSTLVIVAALLLITGIAGLLGVAIRQGNASAIVNGAVALAAAFVPFGLGLLGPTAFEPVLALWVAAAGLLHLIGMLGPYETISWWDHVTHTVSAALVAALLYAVLLARTTLPAESAAGITVLAVLVVGILWEAVELLARAVGERYGIEPVLVPYGWRDTALDLVFDLLGAVIVVVFDLRVFVAVVRRVTGLLG